MSDISQNIDNCASKVDLVILWVDGSDINWREQKRQYSGVELGSDNSEARYRDWDILKYWFRAVEKNIPWFNKVFLVTNGQYPEWLDLSCPRLRFVKHEEFMPKEDLPTFNSNAIEVNIHKIEDLSENFIMFNDDMFIVRPMKEEEFFKNGMPCDEALLDALCPSGDVPNILSNNMAVINNHFSKTGVVRLGNKKWFNIRYGADLYRNFALYPWKRFSGIYNQHLPIAYKKSTFFEVCEAEPERVRATSGNRFRDNTDLSHWLFRYWRDVKGEFEPIKISGSFYTVGKDTSVVSEIERSILQKGKKMICINDSNEIEDFDAVKDRIQKAFDSMYAEKSVFEK